MKSKKAIDERMLALVREREPIKGGAVAVALGKEPARGQFGHEAHSGVSAVWDADRRRVFAALQRLRKAGEIVASREGWRIAGTVCPTCMGTGRMPG